MNNPNHYTLYPRKLKNKTVWYYYRYDKKGKRLAGKSTNIWFTKEKDRIKTRRQAVAKCQTLKEAGALKPKSLTLQAYVKNKNFWIWKKSPYIRGILARSPKDKPGITEGYCLKCGRITEIRILHNHGRKRIDKITPFDCEQLLFKWQGAGFASATVNNWKYIYSTILGEYERELKMKDPKADYFNPWKLVKPLGSDNNKYGGLTINEVRKILYRQAGDAENLYYMAVKIAFLTGLRMGEVLGLYTEDIRDEHMENVRMSYLMISKSYDFVLKKRVLPKDKEVRQVPISANLREELEPFLQNGGNKFLLSFHPDQKTPLSPNHVREWLYKRMEAIGISEEERKERHIAFHSSRRFFNTLLRSAQVADSTIQRFTGHDNDAMTEHYTDYLPEDLQEISRAQDRLLIGGKNE